MITVHLKQYLHAVVGAAVFLFNQTAAFCCFLKTSVIQVLPRRPDVTDTSVFRHAQVIHKMSSLDTLHWVSLCKHDFSKVQVKKPDYYRHGFV